MSTFHTMAHLMYMYVCIEGCENFGNFNKNNLWFQLLWFLRNNSTLKKNVLQNCMDQDSISSVNQNI